MSKKNDWDLWVHLGYSDLRLAYQSSLFSPLLVLLAHLGIACLPLQFCIQQDRALTSSQVSTRLLFLHQSTGGNVACLVQPKGAFSVFWHKTLYCMQTILSRADYLRLPTIRLWPLLGRYRKALGQ